MYFIPRVIFSSTFFACSYFFTIHLDVLRRQIKIETESENPNGCNAGSPALLDILLAIADAQAKHNSTT